MLDVLKYYFFFLLVIVMNLIRKFGFNFENFLINFKLFIVSVGHFL